MFLNGFRVRVEERGQIEINALEFVLDLKERLNINDRIIDYLYSYS